MPVNALQVEGILNDEDTQDEVEVDPVEMKNGEGRQM